MKNFMIVDDSMMIRMNLKRIFEGCGHKVVAEAANGKEAVEKYVQHKPDVITMDITMPIMDGIEALKEIKKADRSVKVIMISALGQEVKILEALNNGACHYILKPFKEADVIRMVESVITTPEPAAI